MKSPIKDYWGKLSKNEDKDAREWHPLVDHCADVAACAHALLSLPLMGRRIARLGGLDTLQPTQIERLGVLAALHDIGKFNHGFQAKALGTENTAGHVSEAVSLLCASDGLCDKLADAVEAETLCGWAQTDQTFTSLLIASISHHGRPEPAKGNARHDIWKPRNGRDPIKGIASLAKMTREWFPTAYEAGGDPLPEAPAFQHGFAGLVMLADWLGSDTHFFPYAREEDGPGRFKRSLAKAHEVLLKMGFDASAARAVLPGESSWSAAVMNGHSMRPAQVHVHSLPLAPAEGSLTVLESETGSGKTEAALLRFVRMYAAGLVDGMYLALPTRTAATQIHKRVVDAVARVWAGVSEEARPPVVLAVPGYLAVDDAEGKRLPHFEVLWNDNARDRMRWRGWAAENSKRYLAGAIVVGTVDQALMGVIKVSHAHLRGTALLRHLVVVDEVHASDAYMGALLEELLRWQMRAGGHAFLMSATLGASMRDRFVHAVERPNKPFHSSKVTPFERAKTAPYPCVLRTSTSVPCVLNAVSETDAEKAAARKSVLAVAKPWIGDPARVAVEALDAAQKGARVLVIRNTVTDCVATQAALEELVKSPEDQALCFAVAGSRAPHHARFARVDRMALDEEIERRFGGKSLSGACVAVATQTVQQSLDLDADILFTDLCPMDVLLQRVGRLHRHRTRDPVRSEGFEQAKTIVLVPEDRDLSPFLNQHAAKDRHGFGTVYDDLRVIEATWRAIEHRERLEIPAMNRELVEETTHPEALAAIAQDFGAGWGKHGIDVTGKFHADRRQADRNEIDREEAFGRLVFPEKDFAEKIATRLGEDDRRAEFDSAVTGPFGGKIKELRIPGWMARGAGEDATTKNVTQESGRVLFDYGNLPYVYDRWGLRARE